MKNTTSFLLLLFCTFMASAQSAGDTTVKHPTIVLVPFQSMMYFSDADRDIARYSNISENQVRAELSNNLDIDIYHQLLAHFEVIDLKRATSLNGEEDLRKIYAATRYTLFSAEQRKAYQEQTGQVENVENKEAKNLIAQFNKKTKDQNFWVSDSTAMLGAIQSNEVFVDLFKKYHEKYLLLITQVELETSNKNTIEWTKQKYNRTYTIHYNLFDHSGNLLRAETLTVKGANDNVMKDINTKYLMLLAQRLKDIIVATDK